MKIIDAYWTEKVNILIIKCDCGEHIHHRSDKWWIACPKCKRRENLGLPRDKYVEEKGEEE